MNLDNLEELYNQADQEIQNLISEFPDDLKKVAEEVPCFLNDYCEDVTPDGFVKLVFGKQTACLQGKVSNGGAIVLYIGTIFKYCQVYNQDFLHSVRRVYMHELGHHLGIATEEELHERGL